MFRPPNVFKNKSRAGAPGESENVLCETGSFSVCAFENLIAALQMRVAQYSSEFLKQSCIQEGF
jgi:hypothetical protein